MNYFRPFEPLMAAHDLVLGRALVIAPHPDDEIIGCGGMIAAHRQAGAQVDVLVMTDGGLGNPTGEGGPEYVALRKDETRKALLHLGGAEVHFLDHPDGRLRETLAPVMEIRALISRLAPATIFFPSPFEVHPDHRAASLHCFRALRGMPSLPRRYVYEIGAMMPVNVLVDITPHMLAKEQAIQFFHSQLLHQDLVGKVRALNRARTVNIDDVSIRYVEAFSRIDSEQEEAYLAAVESLIRCVDGMAPLGGG